MKAILMLDYKKFLFSGTSELYYNKKFQYTWMYASNTQCEYINS